MKTIKNYFTGTMAKVMLLLCLTLSFISCNEDEFEVINGIEPIPTPQALKNLFEAKTASLTNVITFDASTTLNYTSPKGVNLSIIGSCLRKNGSPVTGEVKVTYVEIFDKGNMLTSNKPTLANVGANKELLESGGEFYIQATQDNIKLTLTCPISLDIPTSLTGGTKTGMEPFSGTINSEGELSWDQAITYEILTVAQATTPIYAAIIPSFGWFNCDKFYSTPGPKTTITANVPAGYGANSAVFLAVKTFPNSLGKSYGQFPVGLDCYLIFVTEKDGMFRYAIKQQILTENQQVFFALSETTIGTADEFTTAINALP
ncbi:hypothetical protein FLGE108171_09130 [Flavobacterium gelidilacus]|jgi:hypothetical protein|uniref:hypothetical protein n=1 Tax=Flavobacterium gelidilacus TaxID=206041 RepID=UPI00041B54E9|nr:hypothetical protein [Flavobacterium gelidilacus]